MSKKREEEDKIKESFDLGEALESVNPFMVDGFILFIKNKNIKSKRSFDKLVMEYGGLN